MARQLLAIFAACVVAARASAPGAPAAGAGALAPHPRLILNDTRLAEVKLAIAAHPQAAAYYAALVAQGEYVLGTLPLPRPPENASDILMAARAVLTRVTVVSLLYRLTGNATYAARAVAELVSIASWSDWDIKKHALDTGELSLAFAVGFDWTYDYLSAPSRAPVKAALVAGVAAKSGAAFKEAYAQGARSWSWWTCDPSNWAVVTNGGAGAAALAVLDEPGAPAYYPALLANATAGVRCAAAANASDGGGYAFDGAWWEGPIYAGYADRYFVPFASALETATGSDGGFFGLPGVALAAAYEARAMGPPPAYAYFNWADASETQETLAMLLAVAARAGDGAAAYTLRARLDAAAPGITPSKIDAGSQDAMEFAHALIYWTALGGPAERDAQPLDAALPAKKVALLRSSWADADAAFAGVKAAACFWNHGDLDAGTFVFSWGGQRWVADLGAENYALPAYFGGARFTYYRKSSAGHNTLSFNNASQVATDCGAYARPGPAPPAPSETFLASFGSRDGLVLPSPPGVAPPAACAVAADEQSCVTIDLAPAYQGQGLAAATRRLALLVDGSGLRVRDVWAPAAAGGAGPAAAAMHTFAAVAVAPDGQSATLTRGGRSLAVSLVAGPATCAGAALTATPVRLAPPQQPSDGLTRVDVVAPGGGAACGGFDVLLRGVA